MKRNNKANIKYSPIIPFFINLTLFLTFKFMSSVSWAVLAEGPHREKKGFDLFLVILVMYFFYGTFFYSTFLFFSLFLKKKLDIPHGKLKFTGCSH